MGVPHTAQFLSRPDPNDTKMATCSYSSSDSFLDRKSSLSSELDELLYKAMNMSWRDKARMFREFYYPYHIALTGNYYPRYKITGGMESGTSHVSYLARPYYSYHVPSCYRGFSKYVYVRKM